MAPTTPVEEKYVQNCTENLRVLPGDDVSHVVGPVSKGKKIRLGPGLRQEGERVLVSKCGIFRKTEPNLFWVDNHQKRYVPVKGETVLGIVTAKGGDVFKVDIGGSVAATLSYLAFEGATKRNRPNVVIGDLVYGRLLVANRDMEPELVCMNSSGRSQGLGVISDGGFLFKCSLGLVRKILSPDCSLLKQLGQLVPIEIATGLNGRIWLRCKSVPSTIAIMNAVIIAEFMTEAEIRMMVHRLHDSMTAVWSGK